MVNVEQLMIDLQLVIDALALLLKQLLGLGVADDRGHRIEQGQKRRLVAVCRRSAILPGLAAGQNQQNDQQA